MKSDNIKTVYTKAPEITRRWLVIDAKGKPLGRIAAEAAFILQGKHKPSFTPHVDDGDFCVIVNAHQFILTGRKPNTVVYRHHTGFPGGLKELSHKQMMERKPTFPLEKAVKAMLPKNRLARQMIKKLIILEAAEYKNTSGGAVVKHEF